MRYIKCLACGHKRPRSCPWCDPRIADRPFPIFREGMGTFFRAIRATEDDRRAYPRPRVSSVW